MNIDAIQSAYSSPAVKNTEAADNAQHKLNVQSQPAAAPRDRVTISAAAQSKQPPPAGDKDHDGDSK
jgi:hypothetical protein